MKKLLLLGLAVLGLSACTPSANPINDDPIHNPNPDNDPKIDSALFEFKAEGVFTAPRKGGLIEIPVEYEGEYEVYNNSYELQVVRTKTMQQGTIVLSVGPNDGDADRIMKVIIRYVSKETTTTAPESKGGQPVKEYAEKKIAITQPPTGKEVLFANIVGANALYIAEEQGGVSKSSSSTQKLYKIAATGVVDSVVFKDEYSDTATVAIRYIRNLSEKYVYMSLRVEPRDQDKYYVVRKTDGAVFAAKSPYIYEYTEVQTDHRQNIYYRYGGVCKMYDYNNGVDIVQLTKDYMDVDRYLVDPKGNVLFRYRNSLSGSNENMCYTSSGEFARSAWAAYSNNMFVLKKEPENFYELKGNQIIKVKCTLPALTSEVLFDHLELNGITGFFDGGSCFILDDMTLSLGHFGKDQSISSPRIPAVLRIEDEKNYKIVALNRPQWPDYHKVLKVEGKHLYGYTNDEIFRVSILTGEVETLYANNEYSIYDFSLGVNGVITFSALELRKAQDVLCELRNGQLKVLKTDDSQKIIQLERIN